MRTWILMGLVVISGLLWGWSTLAVMRGAEMRALHEVTRLQAHFDSVDRELQARSPASLGEEQRGARATLIAWLREYRNAARFPDNTDFPGRMVPYFRDHGGTLCAMAYLIARSGRPDLVDDVARTRNNAFIADLSDHHGLRAWLDSVGLNASEAARVQPAYAGPPEPSLRYVFGSLAVDAAAIGSSVVNLAAPGKKSAWAGVVTGLAATTMGLSKLNSQNGNRDMAGWNAVIGIGTLVMSTRGFRSPPTGDRDPLDVPKSVSSSWSIAPVVSRATQGRQVGVVLRRWF